MLKHLSVDEMVALMLAWVDKGKGQAVFLSVPEVAGLHPQVISAYQAVLAVKPAESSPELLDVEAQLKAMDNRHDPLARCVVRTLEAEQERCHGLVKPDTERAARCGEAIKALFPAGLSVINTSYLAESGNTARVAKLLSDKPELETFLTGVYTTDKMPLLDTVNQWIATGAELGKLEQARAEVLAKQVGAIGRVTILEARNQWVRVVSVILNNLEVSTAPLDVIEAIRGPVLRASERAEKRYSEKVAVPEVAAPEPLNGRGAPGSALEGQAPAPPAPLDGQVPAPPAP